MLNAESGGASAEREAKGEGGAARATSRRGRGRGVRMTSSESVVESTDDSASGSSRCGVPAGATRARGRKGLPCPVVEGIATARRRRRKV